LGDARAAWDRADAAEAAIAATRAAIAASRAASVAAGALLAGTHPRMSALITPRDSYAVGNCVPGTVAWMTSHGLAGRTVAPLHEVWKLAQASGEHRAKVACEQLAISIAKRIG